MQKGSKVCLVTSEESFYTNFGAALQGYALSKVIRDMGYEVNILKYKGGMRTNSCYSYMISMLKLIQRVFLIYSINESIIKAKYRIFQAIYRREILRQRKLFVDFARENMAFYKSERVDWLGLQAHPPLADIYVCGSDQIWNPMFKDGTNDLGYFLNFVPSGMKKVAYAPSFGVKDLPIEARKNLHELLCSFSAISVREQAGVEFVQKYAKRDAIVNLDPTLLLSAEEWKKLASLPTNIPQEYILVYRFSNSKYIDYAIDKIRETLELPVVCLPLSGISFEDKKAIKCFDAGPKEFIGLINNATIVCTDSFHATVFSILLGKPFVSFLRGEKEERRNSMNSRIYHLLGLTGLSERIVDENSYHDVNIDLFKRTDNYMNAKNIISIEREKSIKWLQRALSNENEC